MPVVLERSEQILDFSIFQWNGSSHLFLINQLRDLEMYHLDSSNSVIRYLSSREGQLLPASYSSLAYFRNDHHLPLFATVKASQQL